MTTDSTTADTTTPLVALSAGGDDLELAAHGLGMEHINELMVRLAKKLLGEGNRLAFGGNLGDSRQELTKYLIDATQSWLDGGAAELCQVTKAETWPLVNYSAWPFHTFIDAEQRARLVGVCRFINVDPDSVSSEELACLTESWKDEPQALIYIGDALSKMREQSTHDSNLRIVWAGRITGATGWMSGILEEVGYSLAQKKPLLILGGFGGCARVIADFLADESAPWPDTLSLNIGPDYPHSEALTRDARDVLTQRFETVKAGLNDYRSRLHEGDDVNGIGNAIAREALMSDNGRKVTALVAEAAKANRRQVNAANQRDA